MCFILCRPWCKCKKCRVCVRNTHAANAHNVGHPVFGQMCLNLDDDTILTTEPCLPLLIPDAMYEQLYCANSADHGVQLEWTERCEHMKFWIVNINHTVASIVEAHPMCTNSRGITSHSFQFSMLLLLCRSHSLDESRKFKLTCFVMNENK